MQKNKLITIFLLMFVGVATFAQSTTNSPYSKYGVGILRPQSFSRNMGMGGAGIGLRSNRDITGLLNPASYSAISVVPFDVGYTNNALTLDDGTQTQYQNNSYISHLALAFPILKDTWGMSFGVLPYSNVGYKYDEVINDPVAGDLSFFSEGSGAINKAYLGNGFAMNLDSTSTVSFGANAYFLFGTINHDQKIIYGDLANGYNVWNTTDISFTDFGYDIGLQYQKSFTNTKDDKYNLIVGVTYGLASDLDGKRTTLTRSFTGNIDFGTVKDTVELIKDADDFIQLPSSLGFGVSFEKERKWLVAIDYKTTNWGAITSNDPLFTYESNYSLAAGVQFVPKYDGSNYLQRIAYRFGTRFSNSYIAIQNTDWIESGITFGLGLPVRRSGSSYPRLNFGFEYGTNGTTDGGLIKEKFFNFNVGITINAQWFAKRRID
ncbi:MAG: hypothetical protein JKY30_02750 [Flavobacteriales bacterium]|nr:hypothetical protein [Flavobacteriales bacterium]